MKARWGDPATARSHTRMGRSRGNSSIRRLVLIGIGVTIALLAVIPATAHWRTNVEAESRAQMAHAAIAIDGDLTVTLAHCPAGDATDCTRIEGEALQGLPTVASGPATVHVIDWIDKEPGEHVGVTFRVEGGNANLIVKSGNPHRPNGSLESLDNVAPGTHTWLNPACALVAAGVVECEPSSTAAISYIDICLPAGEEPVCAPSDPTPYSVRNIGSLPLHTALSFANVDILPAGGAACEESSPRIELSDPADPAEPLSSTTLCSLESATIELGVIDPGESRLLNVVVNPGSASSDGFTASFEVTAAATVWAAAGAWPVQAHRPASITVLAEPSPAPGEDPGETEDGSADEPIPAPAPGREPPIAEPPVSTTVTPPSRPDPDPSDGGPAQDEPETADTIGFVRLTDDADRIVGTADTSGSGDMSVVLLVAVDGRDIPGDRPLLSQWGAAAEDRNVRLVLTADRRIRLAAGADGSIVLETDPLDWPVGAWVWVRADLTAGSGAEPARLAVSLVPNQAGAEYDELDWGETPAVATAGGAITRNGTSGERFVIGGDDEGGAAPLRIAYVAVAESIQAADESLVFRSDWRSTQDFAGSPPTAIDQFAAGLTWQLTGHGVEIVAPLPTANGLLISAGLAAITSRRPRKNSAGHNRRRKQRQRGGGIGNRALE